MEIHRNWKPYVLGPAVLVLAVVCLLAPQILAATGYQLVFGDWVAYVGAAICLVAGIVYTVRSFRAYAVRIDENGVTWTSGGRTITFGWGDITRASLERKPNSSKKAAPKLLTIWTTSVVEYPVQPNVRLEGLNGFRVAEGRLYRC